MINWNNNDTKYIIKRIILYLLISGIVFCVGTQCAKAETIISHYMCNNNNVNCNSTFNQGSDVTYGSILTSQGQKVFPNLTGYVVFTFTSWEPYSSNAWPLKGVNIRSYTGSGYNVYACEIGSLGGWNDSSTQWQIFSAKCPVSFTSNGLYDIQFLRMNTTNYKYIQRNEIITMVASESDANSIISANQQAVQQQIANANANTTAIANAITNSTTREIDAISSASSQAHQDAQNIVSGLQQATATEQATQDYLKEDYQFDQQMINDFSIFGTNTNYLQQILLWPYNLAISLGSALSGTSCSTYSFGYLYGTELKLPCINWKQYVGNTIYVAIDTIMGMSLLFGVITFIRKAFEYVLNFGTDAYETISVEVFK